MITKPCKLGRGHMLYGSSWTIVEAGGSHIEVSKKAERL
jgi:hypothetical protein